MFLNFQTDYPRQLACTSRASMSYWFCHQNTSLIRPDSCVALSTILIQAAIISSWIVAIVFQLIPRVVILAHCLSVSSPHSVESDRFKFRVNCHSSAQKFPRVSHLTISKLLGPIVSHNALNQFLSDPLSLVSLLSNYTLLPVCPQSPQPCFHLGVFAHVLFAKLFFSQSNTFSFFRILLMLYCTWKSFS